MKLMSSLFGTSDQTCLHRPAELAKPSGQACEECGSGSSLRMCASCGHVGCCDSQAGHARQHHRDTGHAVMVSMPVGGGFNWCYEDDRYID